MFVLVLHSQPAHSKKNAGKFDMKLYNLDVFLKKLEWIDGRLYCGVIVPSVDVCRFFQYGLYGLPFIVYLVLICVTHDRVECAYIVLLNFQILFQFYQAWLDVSFVEYINT